MRSTTIAALLVLSLAPAAALAQTAPQIAAAESTAAAPPAAGGNGGITRDQFIQHAKDRAAQRAATRFDQMDADHDGVPNRFDRAPFNPYYR